ncbi:efflux RND transporter periplasmic adaptor subunit [Arenimonas sp.]|uniref:efflux RND transporter periplasmic adaptor subunit n=1 Tax=Arenimonas sp. TaxID=1872635 RepID=UPI0035B45DED
MTFRPRLAVPVIVIACAAGWLLLGKLRGPELEAYPVTARPLVQTVVATGRVVAVSRAQVGSPVTGVVLERRVREGDAVQPGDVLAVLRADDLEAAAAEAEAALAQLRRSTRPQAEAALREAEARLQQASREAARRRDLFERQLIAREALEQALQAETAARSAAEQARLRANEQAGGGTAEAAAMARLETARAQLAKTTIRAEVAGTVLTRNAEPGDLVQPGRVLFEIARAGDTELLVPVDEKNLQVLALGQPAMCVADAFPDRPFPATVTFIAPSVDAQRGSVDIRLSVSPVPDFLRQDMTVSVNVETGRRDSALVVPNDALAAIDGSSAQVWRVADGRASRQTVGLGLRGMALTEITAGLRDGDQVLADAGADIEDGSRVRVSAAGIPADANDPATRKELPARLD